jgi:hypothetical protein
MVCAKETLGVANCCAAGARLYKSGPWDKDLYLLSFPHRTRVPPLLHCSERTTVPPSLGLPCTTTSHVNQNPCGV